MKVNMTFYPEQEKRINVYLLSPDCPYGDQADLDCPSLLAQYGPLRCSQGSQESPKFNGQNCCKTCLDIMDTSYTSKDYCLHKDNTNVVGYYICKINSLRDK